VTARLGLHRAARLAAAALAIAALAGCGASTLPQIHAEQERLVHARHLMAQRDWGIAAELLSTYVQNNGGAAEVDEAIYLLGECHLKLKDWAGAQTDFERLVRDFPESDSASAGEFMLGEAFWGNARGPDFDQEDTQKALAQWQQFLDRYPDHWRVPEARARVANARARIARKTVDAADLYTKMRYTGPARVYYRKVIDEYADTPLVGDALLGLAMCDALEGRREPAVAALQELEARFPGTPLGVRAEHERHRIEAGKVKPARPRRNLPPSEGAPGITP
jgi:outer membrane protein assembly factor BamD